MMRFWFSIMRKENAGGRVSRPIRFLVGFLALPTFFAVSFGALYLIYFHTMIIMLLGCVGVGVLAAVGDE
jgi:hypothetical protein